MAASPVVGSASTAVKIGKLNLFDYLCNQSNSVLHELFSCPWSCQGIVRSESVLGSNFSGSSGIARYLIMRLLASFPVSIKTVLELWIKEDARGVAVTVLESLIKLRLLEVYANDKNLVQILSSQQESSGSAASSSDTLIIAVDGTTVHNFLLRKNNNSHIRLNKIFRDNIKDYLVIGRTNPFKIYDEPVKNVNVEDIDKQASICWEKVLMFLVGSGESRPSREVRKLLENLGLVTSDSSGKVSITNSGYEFMLSDSTQQIWIILQEYCNWIQSEKRNDKTFDEKISLQTGSKRAIDVGDYVKANVLKVLFRLNFCEQGVPILVESFKEWELETVFKFIEGIGLIQRVDTKPPHFYVTSLGIGAVSGRSTTNRLATASILAKQNSVFASGLSSSGSSLSSGIQIGVSRLFVVCETNFKVYMYSTSPLHAKMLELFVNVNCKLPNMVSGILTRESVQNAFDRGITAAQIIYFLNTNAHPLCLKRRGTIVPDNVTDMITLWEQERTRIKPTKGTLFSGFTSERYKDAKEYANERGMLNWASDSSMKIFISEEFTKLFKDYLRSANLSSSSSS